MKNWRFVVLMMVPLVIRVGVVWAQDSPSNDDLIKLEEEAIRAAVAHVSQSIVQIETLGGGERVGETPANQGPTTGLIVDPDGFVVSSSVNFANQPAAIFVRLPSGKRATAEIVCRDLSRKIVLLKVTRDEDSRLPVPDTVAREEVRVGQRSIALGKVFDASQANISIGIISATNRIWGKAVQTDAKISPNNFGGPLIDLRGRVIGILVPMSPQSNEDQAGAEWYDSGIGFAVPLADIYQRLERMKRGEDLQPGLLGIALKGTNVYRDRAIVATCFGNSPAAKSGIRPGDEVVAVNGNPIRRQSQFRHAVRPLYAGDSVELTIDRDGVQLKSTAELTGKLEPFVQPWLGILLERARNDGVFVKGVIDQSPAESAGLAIGDQIIKFGEIETKSIDDLRNAMISSSIGSELSLLVSRNGQASNMSVKLSPFPSTWHDDESTPIGDPSEIQLSSIKVPEEKNDCLALVPENSGSAPGLLVWVPAPGEYKSESVKANWSQFCQSYNFVLLMPKSSDGKRWTPGEADVIRKMVEQTIKTYSIDRNRIVVGGKGAGGAMACVTAFANRELFRGLVLCDAPIPARIGSVSTDPANRLLVFALNVDPEKGKEMMDRVEILREAKFPVQSALAKNSGWRQSVTQWCDTIDQL